MKKKLLIIFVLVLFWGTPAIANDFDTKNDKSCNEVWNSVWTAAKEGDLESRFKLFVSMAPLIHMTPIVPPGSSGDVITQIRHIVILAVHSHNFLVMLPNQKIAIDQVKEVRDTYIKVAYDLYEMVGFNKNTHGKKFLECVKKKSDNCTKIAVDGKLVPSFEEYAKQIDALQNIGICKNKK